MIRPTGYSVQIRASAEREMKSLPPKMFHRVADAILALEVAPRPRTCKRLRGREEYRIRVGDYHILYVVHDASRTVDIVAVGHRKDVYR
ncbi:MAG: type II toxin-antitoxin system RelE/ParE family toxin [Thermoguttaceae bacterium]